MRDEAQPRRIRRGVPWLDHLYVLGHGLQTVGMAALATLAEEWPRYALYAGCAVQIVGAVGTGFRHLSRGTALLVGAIFVLLGAQWVHGIVAENWSNFIWTDVLGFGLLAGLLVGSRPDMFRYVIRSHVAFLLVSGSLILMSMLDFGLGNSEERVVGNIESQVFRIPVVLVPAAMIVLVPRIAGRLGLVIGFGGLATMFLFGVVTLTRLAIVIPLLAIALSLQAVWRQPRVLVVLLLAATLIGAVGVNRWGSGSLLDSWDSVMRRFDSSDVTSGRQAEGDYFLRSLSENEMMVGKGLGGSYFGVINANAQYGIAMVHYGHLHLILKGGVLLLGAMGLLFLYSLYRGIRSDNEEAKAAVKFVVVFLAMNAMHNQFSLVPGMALAAICVGRALAPDVTSKRALFVVQRAVRG